MSNKRKTQAARDAKRRAKVERIRLNVISDPQRALEEAVALGITPDRARAVIRRIAEGGLR